MPTIAQLRERPMAKPVLLVEITLLNGGGTLYFSTRNIDYSGQRYEDYVSYITGLEEELLRSSSEFRNADVTINLKNENYKTYDHLVVIGDTYPFEGAGVTIKMIYIDINDNSLSSDYKTVFVGDLESPKNIDLLSFEVTGASKEFTQQFKNRRQ